MNPLSDYRGTFTICQKKRQKKELGLMFLSPNRTHSYRLVLAASFAISVIGQAFWLSAPAMAQTPTSDLYAVTNLHNLANLGMDSYSYSNSIAGGIAVGGGMGSNTNSYQAFRWNADGTATNLGDLIDFGTASHSYGTGIYNGATIGYGNGSNTNYNANALLWNADDTVTNLGILVNFGMNTSSIATGIAGNTIVGYGYGSDTSNWQNALRWNADGTVTNLHTIANLGTNFYSFANGIDGEVIIGGYGSNTNYTANAFRWNADGTVTNLHNLADLGTDSGSLAYGISEGVTVGYGYGSNTNDTYNALRWNVDGTVTNLHGAANLGSNSYSQANGIAGGITVGFGRGSNTDNTANALRWNADGTSLNLNTFTNIGSGSGSTAVAIDAATGVIAGIADDQAVLWTPINAGVNGANRLTVRLGATTTINQDFTQTAGETKVNGALALDDTNATNGTETFTLAGGTLSGAGTITGNLANTGGIVSPGNSPGTLTIHGDYAQSGAGILKIEIASLSDFDTLNIIGNASLGGTLDISFIDAYEPALDSFSFDLLNIGGTVTGTFDTIHITGGNLTDRGFVTQIDTLPGGGGYTLSLVGVVVPESGSVVLFGLTIPILGASITCRKRK